MISKENMQKVRRYFCNGQGGKIFRTGKARRGDIEAGDDAGGQFIQGALVSV
jgi:hypothetical protein